MSDRKSSGFRNKASNRLKLGGLLLLAALGLGIFAVKVQSKAYLTSAPSESRESRQYTRMWFDSADDLLGAWWQSGKLVVERWQGTNSQAGWLFEIPDEKALWKMAPDDSRIAWIAGSELHVQAAAPESKPVVIALPAHKPLDLTLLSNGSAAVIFDDLFVRRWDTATGSATGEWKAPLRSAERAAADGDEVAFSSVEDGSLRVFAFHGNDWVQVQKSLSPELPERVVIPAASVAATLVEGRVRSAGVTLSSPGAIHSVAAHLYDVIGAGDFAGIFVMTPDGEYYKLADAEPGSVVAAGETRFAVSGKSGTRLFRLGSEDRLTPMGRKVSLSALVLAALAAILLFWPLLIQALAYIFGRKKTLTKRLVVSGTLEPPPPELVDACASGRMILWAGAGLSAQSGFPTRAAFIQTMIESSAREFAEPALVRKLRSLCQSGKNEDALNELVAATRNQRGALISHFTAVYARFSPPSRSHELLGKLDLHSAVTTNYDVLLEQIRDAWGSNVTALGDDKLEGRFLLKLYGSLRNAASVLLSRAEFKSALERPNVGALRDLLASRPFLFIGCSLDALVGDLHAIKMPESAMSHFAIAGVGAGWQRTAEELSRRYRVRALVCDEQTIGEQLPLFLDALVRGVQKAQSEPVRAYTVKA